MKTNVRRWLPAVVQNRTNSALLGMAALALIGAAVAAPAATAGRTSTISAEAAADNIAAATGQKPASPDAQTAAADQAAAAAKAAADKETAILAAAPVAANLQTDVQLQPNYFYCGPAATRIALTAHGVAPTQDQVAQALGTTTSGTNSAFDITRVLNQALGAGRYQTTEIAGQRATPQQMDKLQRDIVLAINQGDPVVANIAGTMQDTAGEVHSYEGGHYLTVIGYADQGRTAVIGDPADAVGSPVYQLSTIDLANWIASRGYSS